jgi:hypothetical protein
MMGMERNGLGFERTSVGHLIGLVREVSLAMRLIGQEVCHTDKSKMAVPMVEEQSAAPDCVAVLVACRNRKNPTRRPANPEASLRTAAAEEGPCGQLYGYGGVGPRKQDEACASSSPGPPREEMAKSRKRSAEIARDEDCSFWTSGEERVKGRKVEGIWPGNMGSARGVPRDDQMRVTGHKGDELRSGWIGKQGEEPWLFNKN